MAFKDLSHLATATPPTVGMAPDAEPRFVTKLAEAYYERYLAEGRDLLEAAFGARWRGSWSGLCSRALQYNLEGLAPSEPPTIADAWRWGLGTMVHEALQRELPKMFPTAYIEVEIEVDDWGGIHADALICQPGPYQPPDIDPKQMETRTLLELKTINGFGYKMSVGARGVPKGPRAGAVVQGCMAGKYSNATEVVIGYLSMELLSPREADKINADEIRRFAAEWTIPHHTMLRIADEETARVKEIMAVVDENVRVQEHWTETGQGDAVPVRVPRIIPDPEIPAGAVIINPAKGEWQEIEGDMIANAGTTWHCGYCPHKGRCAFDGA